MANERQFFRDINPGDVSIEGRKSNGVTADINGNTIIYAGIKQSELQKLNQEKYLGNVPIDGYTSTFIAALAPGQLPPYPAGNNNNETYFESKTTDPNKIIVANQQITPTPTPQPTITITPTPTSLPTTETTASKPAPDVEGGFVFLDETGFAIEPVQLTNLDIDLGPSPDIVVLGKDEKALTIFESKKTNKVVKNIGAKANDFLPRNNNGEVTPYYNFLTAAEASINTYTREIAGTVNGTLGCGAGVSIIYLRATGHGFNFKQPPTAGKDVNLDLGTATISSALAKDTKNWRRRSDWRDAQPGDILVTVTLKQGNNGHIGWVISTKINDGKSYDVISNSSKGYTGKVNDKSKAGSIQRNYTVNKWSEIASRNGVGPTYAYEFIGTFGKTI
jgi:hypothetical protein